MKNKIRKILNNISKKNIIAAVGLINELYNTSPAWEVDKWELYNEIFFEAEYIKETGDGDFIARIGDVVIYWRHRKREFEIIHR